MNALPGDENFLQDNSLNNCGDLSKFPFDNETLEKIGFNLKNKKNSKVSRFNDKVKEEVKTGISLEALVHQVVASALEIEFGKKFLSVPGNDKISAAIAKTIQEDPDLLERVVAVALKGLIEKNKNLS